METEVEVLQIDTSKGQQSIAGLRKEIKQLKDQLVGLEEGTEEYNRVLSEVANKTHQLKEINEQVRKSSKDFGDQMANVRGVMGGLSGAFQTVLGSLSLMGVQIGDDVKMLKMLQSAMAITQGVAAIDSGVKAFKALTIAIKASTVAMSGFKKAMVATGIGALIAGVGLLISKLGVFDDKIEESSEAIEKFFKGFRESMTGTAEDMDRQAKVMKMLGATEEEIEKDRLDRMKSTYNEMVALENQIVRQIQNTSDEAEKSGLYEYLDKLHTEINSLASDIDNFSIDSMINDMQRIVDRVNKEFDEKERRAAAAAKTAAAERKKLAMFQDEDMAKFVGDKEYELYVLEKNYTERKALYEKYKASTIILDAKYEKEKKEIEEKYKKEDEQKWKDAYNKDQINAELAAETEYQLKRAQILIANEKDMDDQLLQLEMDYRDQREVLLRERFEQGLIDVDEFNNQIAQLEVEAANLQIEQEEMVTQKLKEEQEKRVEQEKKTLEQRKKLNENYRKAVGSITNSIASILGSIGDTLEQGSQEWKNVNIAKAIISTIQGSISAYMGMVESIPGPAGLIAGALAAGATAAAGYAEVQKIKNTNISTSGSTGGSGGTELGSVSASAIQVAATQVTNTRQTSTTSDIEELPEQRVYVLESDITDAQNNVRTTVRQATF